VAPVLVRCCTEDHQIQTLPGSFVHQSCTSSPPLLLLLLLLQLGAAEREGMEEEGGSSHLRRKQLQRAAGGHQLLVPLRAAAEVAEVDHRLVLVAGSETEAYQLPGTVMTV
jgi:hypothetical protein